MMVNDVVVLVVSDDEISTGIVGDGVCYDDGISGVCRSHQQGS